MYGSDVTLFLSLKLFKSGKAHNYSYVSLNARYFTCSIDYDKRFSTSNAPIMYPIRSNSYGISFRTVLID